MNKFATLKEYLIYCFETLRSRRECRRRCRRILIRFRTTPLSDIYFQLFFLDPSRQPEYLLHFPRNTALSSVKNKKYETLFFRRRGGSVPRVQYAFPCSLVRPKVWQHGGESSLKIDFNER